MTIFEALKRMGLPCAYSHFKKPQKPPYIVYIGDGQANSKADNTLYWRENTYQVEYYFTAKNEDNEAVIEQTLLDNGWLFEKSEDVYLEEDDVFLIYYYTTKGA
jgi:hypothetical protein